MKTIRFEYHTWCPLMYQAKPQLSERLGVGPWNRLWNQLLKQLEDQLRTSLEKQLWDLVEEIKLV